MKKIYYFVFLLALSPIFSLSIASQTTKKKISLNNSNEKLRELYSKRDYESCAELGKTLVAKLPRNFETRAWTISCQSRISEQREGALRAAQELISESPNEGWGWFALASAQIANQKSNEALISAEKALAIEPDNENFIFVKAQSLSAQRKYEEAETYLRKNSEKIRDKSKIAYTEALFLFNRSIISFNKTDGVLRKQSFEYFAKAVSLNPESLIANYLYGSYLNIDNRYTESYPLLKKSAALAPNIVEIHKEFWKSINVQLNKTEAQKKAEINADINILLKAAENSPAAIFAVSQQYGEMQNAERQLFYEDQILKKYSGTKYAEDILYSRIHIFEGQSAGKIENQDKLRAMYWEYVNRAKHFNENKLGDIYYYLLQLSKSDKKLTDDDFTKIINGALKYRVTKPIQYGIDERKFFARESRYANVSSDIALVINARNLLGINSNLAKDAEKYARDGVAESKEKKAANNEIPETRRKEMQSSAESTLGAILLAEKKYDEAESILSESLVLNDENFSANSTLAQLYTEKNDFDKAEQYHLKNADGSSRDKNIFSQFYEKRKGNLEGFDTYFAGIKEKINNRLKEKVLASKIKDPKNAVPFALKTIDDKNISLNDLKGKIVIISVWGTWCSPCVKEMPQLQRLYKQYEQDKGVAIITMDTNDELETVRKFMADKKYEFPVLIGDTYTDNIIFDSSVGFPTTLFIGRNGKISFIKVGESEKLFEEFGWRIEALKSDK